MTKGKPILMVLVVLIALGGGAAWYLHLLPTPGSRARVAAAAPAPPPPPAPAVPVRVSELVTNLAGTGQQRYIQLAMTVEMDSAADADQITKKMPAVDNAVLLAARAQTAAALGTISGVAAFKKILATSFDKLLGKPKAVRQIYFTQFVIQ